MALDSHSRKKSSGEGESPAAERSGLDSFSLEDVLRELRPKIRMIFASSRVPYEDAEDILQESLLALVLNRGEIWNVEGWLLVVIRRRSLAYWRGRRIRQERVENVDPEELERQ